VIFDKAGLDEEEGYPESGIVADDYLVAGASRGFYHVHWERVAKWDGSKWNETYENIKGERISVLNSWAKEDKLFGGYKSYKKGQGVSDPFYFDNPIPKDNR
jgi:hypothetical protein